MRCRKDWLWLWQPDYSQELLTLAWKDCYALPGRNKTIFLNCLLLPVLRFFSRMPQNFPTLLMGDLVISISVYSWTTRVFCLWSNDIVGLAQFCPPVYLQSSKRPFILVGNKLALRIQSFSYPFLHLVPLD